MYINNPSHMTKMTTMPIYGCSVVVGAVPEGGPQMAQTLNEIKVLLHVHNIIDIYIPTIK